MHCKLGKKLYLLESRGEGHRRDCSLGQPWKLEEGGGGERERMATGSTPYWESLGHALVHCSVNNAGTKRR